MTLMMPAKEYDWRLEEALRFLKSPDFVPIGSQPAQVELNGPLHFRFPTPQPSEFPENNIVHGRLWVRAGLNQPHPWLADTKVGRRSVVGDS
jgi:hypothetical protein